MTLLQRCPKCDDLMPLDSEDCGKHGNVCACGKPTIGASLTCPECKKVADKQRYAHIRAERRKAKEAAKKKVEKRIGPMTIAEEIRLDREQHKLNLQIDRQSRTIPPHINQELLAQRMCRGMMI